MQKNPRESFSSIRCVRDGVLYFSPGTWRWVSRRRSHHNLWIGLRGSGTMSIESNRFSVSAGTGVLIPPDVAVGAIGDGPGDVLNIGLHFTVSHNEALHFSCILGKPVRIRRMALLQEMASLLQEWVGDSKLSSDLDALARQMVRVFVFDALQPVEDPVDRTIRSQAEVMRSEPGRHTPVSELSSRAGLSPAQYTRRFRRLFQASPGVLAVSRRIEAARHLLLESTLGVEQIAEALGYSNSAFFSRQFKLKTGVAPGEFRGSGRVGGA
jgi:AraC family transcriptional regulator, arabinose operon regulatory protein